MEQRCTEKEEKLKGGHLPPSPIALSQEVSQPDQQVDTSLRSPDQRDLEVPHRVKPVPTAGKGGKKAKAAGKGQNKTMQKKDEKEKVMEVVNVEAIKLRCG